MKYALIFPAIGALLLASSAGVAFGANSQTGTTAAASGPTQTGQPNQSCGSATAPNTPGNAATASGSAFNPDGKAGTVYAGQGSTNQINIATNSQYDVACSHVPG